MKPGAPSHGTFGPIKVSYGGKHLDIGKQFLDVAAVYDTARELGEDPNDLVSVNQYCVRIELFLWTINTF